MGSAGAAGAVAHFRPLGHASFLAALVGPRAGFHEAHQNMTIPPVSVEGDFGRQVGHGREARLGNGRDARQISRLSQASDALHFFAASRFAYARRGGVQMGGRLGVDPRGVGPQTRAQTPVAALFSIARRATFQFPNHKWSQKTSIFVKGAKFSRVNQHSPCRFKCGCERIYCCFRYPTMGGLYILEISGVGNWIMNHLGWIALRVKGRVGRPSAGGL